MSVTRSHPHGSYAMASRWRWLWNSALLAVPDYAASKSGTAHVRYPSSIAPRTRGWQATKPYGGMPWSIGNNFGPSMYFNNGTSQGANSAQGWRFTNDVTSMIATDWTLACCFNRNTAKATTQTMFHLFGSGTENLIELIPTTPSIQWKTDLGWGFIRNYTDAGWNTLVITSRGTSERQIHINAASVAAPNTDNPKSLDPFTRIDISCATSGKADDSFGGWLGPVILCDFVWEDAHIFRWMAEPWAWTMPRFAHKIWIEDLICDVQTRLAVTSDVQTRAAIIADAQARVAAKADAGTLVAVDADTQTRTAVTSDAQARAALVADAQARIAALADAQTRAALLADAQARAAAIADAQARSAVQGDVQTRSAVKADVQTEDE
jgi:hypothetical protein